MILEPIWFLFQGVPLTTTQGDPISEHSQRWAACYSEREPPHCWANLITRWPFSLGTCLPYFLSTGSNLARAYLEKTPREETKESRSQDHPEAKAKPVLPQSAYFCSHRDESNERPLCSVSELERGIGPG